MIARRLAAAALLATVVLSGCAHAAPNDAARFDNQFGDDAVACLVHQRSQPDSAYEGGPRANTLRVLTMLHYYVANGDKPYCDGRPPGEVDRAWLGVYLRLGADPAHVVRYAKPVAHPAPTAPAGAKP
ncbi:MAG: hypothetical protein JWL57_381 [Actinobacteria bacterium]|nr:hypothetical protein [Actinomycetota bacterium]